MTVGHNHPTPVGSGAAARHPARKTAPQSIACNGCDNRWTGLSACHCGACHETFTGIGAFDRDCAHGRCRPPGECGLVRVDRPHWSGWGQRGEKPPLWSGDADDPRQNNAEAS